MTRETLDHLDKNQWYTIYTLYIKGKKPRIIEAPCEDLKQLQRSFIQQLNSFPFHSQCMAISNSNTIKNAQQHFTAESILKIDIEKCYRFIQFKHVENNIKQYGSQELKDLLPDILKYCFLVYDNGITYLPTGAATSPILCNIALTNLDYKIHNILLQEKTNYTFTRYIDDIIISSNNKVYDKELKTKIETLLYQYDLKPNKKKNGWSSRSKQDKMIVTGVKINGTNRIPRDLNRMLRAKLNNIAMTNQELDQETNGYLAYVKALDSNHHATLLNYFQERKQRYVQLAK
jgi:hypothetical protein